MNESRLASIIINNYNYGRFLRDAIDSALNQTYSYTEIIVVDDGSTDNSRELIASYGDRVCPVLKENGGQGSTFNAGFAASHGEVIFFLDADDRYLPTAVEQAMSFFDVPETVKVHWPMWRIDAHGKNMGQLHPSTTLPQGDLREEVYRDGPAHLLSATTSGNAWARHFILRMFPLPESIYYTGAETCLIEAAPFFGLIGRISQPQGLYRLHECNRHASMSLDEKLARGLTFYDHYARLLNEYCQSMSRQVDMARWRAHSWWHRVELAVNDINSLTAPESRLVFIDDETWDSGLIADRQRIPFLEQDGQYWGRPPDDETAITELERLIQLGAHYIVFVWSTFWWLDHYTAWHDYLHSKFRCILKNERLIIFDLMR